MSKSLSRSFLSLCELNIQLGQTLLEEGNVAGQQLLTIEYATDAISIAASRAQPAAEKLRAYQQHMSRVVADTQLELSRVTEQHAPVTLRTARELADQVAHVAAEETEKSTVKQQDMMKNFRDPFHAAAGNGSASAHGNMQSAGDGVNGHAEADGKRGAGSLQGGQATQPSGNKGSAKSG